MVLLRPVSSFKDLAKLKNERAKPGESYVPTTEEHIANMLTHGLWILPSFFASLWMQNKSSTRTQELTSMIYGSALICLFTVSTVFHFVSYRGKQGYLRYFFHIGDRAVIYIFIASSYTPWLMLKDFGGLSNLTMWVVWTGAFLGILYNYMFYEKYKTFEVILYLMVGVCPAFIVIHMADSGGIFELAVGGLTYITGVVFFKCDGIIPFAHAIWHCFVLGGALMHFYAINTYLIGAKATDL